MWIKKTTSCAFLSSHIYIVGPILSAIVNYPFSYVTREVADKYYNRMIYSLTVELIKKAGKMLMKLQLSRMGKLKNHNTEHYARIIFSIRCF